MREEKGKESRLADAGTLSLVVFYLLAFAISWLGFVPAIAGSFGMSFFRSRLWQVALVLPGIGPAAAAGFTSARFVASADGDTTPWKRLTTSFLKPVSLRWWAITITLAIGIMGTASLLSFNLDQVRTTPRASISGVLLFSVLSAAANPLEEIGWRGFAQNRLQKAHGAFTGAVIVGVLWAVWHIPLFFLSNSPMSMAQTPFWAWSAGVIPQAILLAWLYNSTGYSLATVSVFHVLGNIAGYLLSSSTATVSAVRLAAALAILLVSGPDLGKPLCADRSS